MRCEYIMPKTFKVLYISPLHSYLQGIHEMNSSLFIKKMVDKI